MVALYWLYTYVILAFAPTNYAFAITGLQGGVNADTGERPVRQEISAFQHAGAAFDLYILALQQFMQQNQSDPRSYFQIAGIHGYPVISWDGADGKYNNGYCPHGSILFPTWHRAYMALFEQILSGHAQQIASTYHGSSAAVYQSAATTLRMPYWDWAANTTMPDVVNQPTINVNTPNGSHLVTNPLYNYTFHPLPSSPEFPDSPVAKFPSTVRHADQEGRSDPSQANAILGSMAPSIRKAIYDILTVPQDYASFSNTGGDAGYSNIENVHNAIHIFVGGPKGHMEFIPLSSFDPVFWLHHTNVDRILAIWQAAFPDTYMTEQENTVGTYTNDPGAVEDASSALTPFRSNDSGDFYDSNTTRTTRHFGYTYPELLDWKGNASTLASDLKTHVNDLYGPTTSKHYQRRSESRLTVADMAHDYAINVVVNGSDVTTGMYVRFFLGVIPTLEALWATAPSLVGSHIITGPSKGPVFGQVPLNPKLTTFDLANLEAENVVPLIAEQLNYRVQGFDGRAVDPNMLPSLKFAVVGRDVTHLGANEFPEYGPVETFTEATKGLAPHGLCEGERMPA